MAAFLMVRVDVIDGSRGGVVVGVDHDRLFRLLKHYDA